MLVADLPIPDEVKQILILKGIKELYPPQADAVNTGVLEGKNLVLASPTASGKTLIAELCALKHVLERRGKVLYLSPLRALAWEKFEGFEEYTGIPKPGGGKIRVGVSTGDLDNKSPWLEGYDIVITTNEKCDSLLRHRSPWMSNVSLVIADEVHLIGDERGPTLEIVLARLRQINPNIQILALSATIKNSIDVAEWLHAECVSTNWRPIPLNEGVAYEKQIYFKDGTIKPFEIIVKNDSNEKINPVNIVIKSIMEGGQSLIFVESRRRAESLARKTSLVIPNYLSPRNRVDLISIAETIEHSGEKTRLGEDLKNIVSNGVAFHHAGLATEHRRIIEKAFRDGKIKLLIATPTLAAGVNLPARTVIIGSYKRYILGYGMYDIPVLEYKQMSGRAGRPQYDPYGEAILLAGSKDEKDQLFEKYINSEPERLDSRLAQESALRRHVLAAIASEYAFSETELLEFIKQTFFGFNNHVNSIKFILTPTLRYLSKENMIEEKNGFLSATPLGHRISELYIDPVSAVIIKEGLLKKVENLTPFTWLHLIARTPDMRPIFRINNTELELIENEYNYRSDQLSIKLNENSDWIDNQQELSYIKTAIVLEEWINEKSENDILEKYSVQPGDRYSAIQNADWLLYSLYEISDILKIKENRSDIDKLRMRVKYGIKEDILSLIQLKNIGRIRARRMYQNGIKQIDDLKRIPLKRLVELLGPKIAKSVKEEIGGLVEEQEWKSLDKPEKEQKALTDFVEEKFEPEKDNED